MKSLPTLAAKGARVVMACRNTAKAQEIAVEAPGLVRVLAAQAAMERELLVECEAALVIELNRTRVANNLPLCVPHPRLAAIARQHS